MRYFIIIIAFSIMCASANSATWYVPDDHPTIQQAIDRAQNGDTVVVKPGTYFECINFLGKAIIVVSEQGADNTTIDGGSPHDKSVVKFKNGEGTDSVLEGFTVTNGDAPYAGGILCYWSSPTIMHNIITGNRAAWFGGGIDCVNSSPIIKNNIITENEAGMGSGGGISCYDCLSPVIENNTITGNKALSWGGGGIYCEGFINECSPIIKNNTIIGNEASVGGGGIECIYCSSSTITNNTITGNSGCGIECFDCTSVTISNNIITENSGYGINCGYHYSSLTISNNTITDNNSGGIYCYKCSGATIVNNTITQNSDSGIYLNYNSPMIMHNTITGNTGYSDGGGVSCYNSSPLFINNIVAHNESPNGSGGGFFCYGSSPIFTNNTIMGNTAGQDGGGIFIRRCDPVIVTNTILWNNTATSGPEIQVEGDSYVASTLIISYSDVYGGLTSIYLDAYSTLNWGPGNIDADPLFLDPFNDDFHLAFASPCIDAGDNTVLPTWLKTDFEGDPRIIQGLAPGYGKSVIPLGGPGTTPTVDIGADEFCRVKYRKPKNTIQ